jgi:hypothetical protein
MTGCSFFTQVLLGVLYGLLTENAEDERIERFLAHSHGDSKMLQGLFKVRLFQWRGQSSA